MCCIERWFCEQAFKSTHGYDTYQYLGKVIGQVASPALHAIEMAESWDESCDHVRPLHEAEVLSFVNGFHRNCVKLMHRRNSFQDSCEVSRLTSPAT